MHSSFGFCVAVAIATVASGRVLRNRGDRGSRLADLHDSDVTSVNLSNMFDPPLRNYAHFGAYNVHDPRAKDFVDCNTTWIRGKIGKPLWKLPADLDVDHDLINYQRLFAKWNGKAVLFGGDSLMRELWLTIGCAASLLGGSVQTTVVKHLLPTGGGAVLERPAPVTDYWQFDANTGLKERQKLSAVLSSIQVTGVYTIDGAADFSMHFLYYYSSRDRAIWVDPPKSQIPLMIANDVLLDEVTGHDLAYLNIGHQGLNNCVLGPNGDVTYNQTDCQAAAKALIDLAAARKLPVTFIDHPPAHFMTPSGEYDKNVDDEKCGCPDKNAMKEQFTYKCEVDWMRNYLHTKHKAPMVRWFDAFADKCDAHFPESRDCGHYVHSPLLHDSVISDMLKLLESST